MRENFNIMCSVAGGALLGQAVVYGWWWLCIPAVLFFLMAAIAIALRDKYALYFGIRNRLYLSIGHDDMWLDVGRIRFNLRWLSAEDGRTWNWRFYTFTRDWTY